MTYKNYQLDTTLGRNLGKDETFRLLIPPKKVYIFFAQNLK